MFSREEVTSNESITRNIAHIFPNVVVGQDSGHLSIHITVEAPHSHAALSALGQPSWCPRFFTTQEDLALAVACANRTLTNHWSNEQAQAEERRVQVSLLARAAGITPAELETHASINVRYEPWTLTTAAAEFATFLAGEALDCDDPEALLTIMRHALANDTVALYAADAMNNWLTEGQEDAEYEALMQADEDNVIHDIFADMLAA